MRSLCHYGSMTRPGWVSVLARLLLARLWIQANQSRERTWGSLFKCMFRFAFLLSLAFLELVVVIVYVLGVNLRRWVGSLIKPREDLPTFEE
mgnify:CR=1 FL=1